MPVKATIEVKVEYDAPPNPPMPAPPAAASDSVEDVSTTSLSGSGDETGASTDKTIPNGPGQTRRVQKKTPVPAGARFKSATVIMTLDCPGQNLRTITLTGDVSASGRVEGNCIVVTAVNRTFDGRTETITTDTARRCCGDSLVRARPPRTEQVALRTRRPQRPRGTTRRGAS